MQKCSKQTIILEKYTTENHRTLGAIPSAPKSSDKIEEEVRQMFNQPKCPKCGSTEFPVRKK